MIIGPSIRPFAAGERAFHALSRHAISKLPRTGRLDGDGGANYGAALVTIAHSTPGMLALTLAAGIWLYRRGQRYWIVALVASVPGGMLRFEKILCFECAGAKKSPKAPMLSELPSTM